MRMVVVAGGSQPDKLRLLAACGEADCVLAADSGAAWLQQWDIRPDVLLGDFDSLHPEILKACQENGHTRWVRHREDKDQTDMELCVAEVLRLGATSVRFFGAVGTRLDHSLANLSLLYPFFQAGIPAWVEDSNNRVTMMGALPRPGETEAMGEACVKLEREEGFKVSLLALPPGVKQVVTHGLRYDMRGRDLPFGSTLAVSNEFEAPEAEIRFAQGLAWLLLSRD